MLQIATIVFREVLEIFILISIILAATASVPQRKFYVTLGVMLGVIGSSVVAIFTRVISEALDSSGQEIFNIIILTISIFLITSTLIWMKSHSKKITNNIKSVSNQVVEGRTSKIILTTIISTCILREGSEIVLFVYSVLAAHQVSYESLIIGFFLGGSIGAACGACIYLGILKFSGKYAFKISSVLLIFIAAGLASEVANLISAAELVDPSMFTEPLWDSSGFIMDDSFIGKLLNILTGYTSKPSALQIVFFISTLGIITSLLKLNEQKVTSQSNYSN
jgi:high-affinity iron transporter